MWKLPEGVKPNPYVPYVISPTFRQPEHKTSHSCPQASHAPVHTWSAPIVLYVKTLCALCDKTTTHPEAFPLLPYRFTTCCTPIQAPLSQSLTCRKYTPAGRASRLSVPSSTR